LVILDSSALVAVVLREQGHERLRALVEGSPRNGVGTPTLVETGLVLHGRVGAVARTALQRLLDDMEIERIAFADRHWPIALHAFARFGKGRHPAALNLGDCLTYAMARVAGEPLLCVGDDFAQTDLELA
jgi:ribonuclease VapC